MKKIAIYMYDTAPMFEISIIAYLLNTQYEVCIVTDNLPIIKTSEGVFIKSNLYLNEINVDEFDGLIICGGEYSRYNNDRILECIDEFRNKNRLVAGICSGRDLVNLALKENYTIRDTVECVCDNVIFSSPNKYAMFGIIVGKHLEIYEDEDDYNETVEFFVSK
ncbi:DJ-1/PfpI family protein [Filifactor villosus]|uniref:DJ-1/PfpI family protein n=1 Tax=Filifactor villosus TaxID=29374 RepID=A0ABV9QJK4_9FIRM